MLTESLVILSKVLACELSQRIGCQMPRERQSSEISQATQWVLRVEERSMNTCVLSHHPSPNTAPGSPAVTLSNTPWNCAQVISTANDSRSKAADCIAEPREVQAVCCVPVAFLKTVLSPSALIGPTTAISPGVAIVVQTIQSTSSQRERKPRNLWTTLRSSVFLKI